MNPTTAGMAIAAPLLGLLIAWSTGQWLDGLDQGTQQLDQSRQALVQSAGLMDLHNQVYSQVGETTWETRVKPDYLSAITRETIAATGNPMPSSQNVVDWV